MSKRRRPQPPVDDGDIPRMVASFRRSWKRAQEVGLLDGLRTIERQPLEKGDLLYSVRESMGGFSYTALFTRQLLRRSTWSRCRKVVETLTELRISLLTCNGRMESREALEALMHEPDGPDHQP
jgi:hypothetical protein